MSEISLKAEIFPSSSDEMSYANHTITENAHKELSELIRHQFDLEILLKHHELNTIDDEIAKIHILMIQMRKSLFGSSNISIPNEPTHFTNIYAKFLSQSISSKSTEIACKSSEHNSTSCVANYQPPLTRSKSNKDECELEAIDSKSHLLNISDAKQKISSPSKLQCITRRNDGVLVRYE